jgi:hypothetical protein
MKPVFLAVLSLLALSLITSCSYDDSSVGNLPESNHSNPVLSQQVIHADGKSYLVRRFIVTQNPLETHSESVPLR